MAANYEPIPIGTGIYTCIYIYIVAFHDLSPVIFLSMHSLSPSTSSSLPPPINNFDSGFAGCWRLLVRAQSRGSKEESCKSVEYFKKSRRRVRGCCAIDVILRKSRVVLYKYADNRIDVVRFYFVFCDLGIDCRTDLSYVCWWNVNGIRLDWWFERLRKVFFCVSGRY